MRKSHNLHLTSWLKRQLLTPQKNLICQKRKSIKLTALILYFIQVSYLTTALKLVKHHCERSQGRKISNEEKIKKLAFRLDRINNKMIRFLSHKEFLEKCFRDKLTPNGLKINLEPTIGNQNEEFVNQWYKIQDDCAKQLMKMTIKFCETRIKETEHEIKEIDSKLQSNLRSTEHNNIKGQVSKNQEVTIQQLRKKKTRKYRQLKYGEQIPEKQTRKSSVKSSQPNQEENNSNNS